MPELLDTWGLGKAISLPNIGSPGMAGEFIESGMFAPMYWNALADTWQSTPPTGLLPRSEVGVWLLALNTGDVAITTMRMSIFLYNPNGSLLSANTIYAYNIAPGSAMYGSHLAITTQGGMYYAKGFLYGE